MTGRGDRIDWSFLKENFVQGLDRVAIITALVLVSVCVREDLGGRARVLISAHQIKQISQMGRGFLFPQCLSDMKRNFQYV